MRVSPSFHIPPPHLLLPSSTSLSSLVAVVVARRSSCNYYLINYLIFEQRGQVNLCAIVSTQTNSKVYCNSLMSDAAPHNKQNQLVEFVYHCYYKIQL